MILMIFGISLLILAVGIYIWKVHGRELWNRDLEWIYCTINTVGGILVVISLIAALIVGVNLSNRIIIDNKIALYQEENDQIEKDISTIVNNYMDYEQDTFSEFKNDNPAVLVSMYPELKSDTLISKQIEVYAANNQEIKSLKALKLNLSLCAWWLYFGK